MHYAAASCDPVFFYMHFTWKYVGKQLFLVFPSMMQRTERTNGTENPVAYVTEFEYMKMIHDTEFKRIYVGQMLSLCGWFLAPVIVLMFIFGVSNSADDKVFHNLVVSYRILSSFLTVFQVVSAVEILGGLVNLRKESALFNKACGWSIAYFFLQTAFAVFDTFVSVIGRNNILLLSLPEGVQFFRTAELPLNLLSTCAISFFIDRYLLKAYTQLFYDYGGSERQIRITRFFGKVLFPSSIVFIISFVVLWTVYIFKLDTASFVLGQMKIPELESRIIRIVCYLLSCTAVISLLTRVFTQIGIISQGMGVSRTIKSIMR